MYTHTYYSPVSYKHLGCYYLIMKKNYIFSLIGLIIIALIALAIVLPGKEKKEDSKPEQELAFSTPELFAGEGDMAYSFDSIRWDLNLIEAGSARVPETRIGFYFENFTRRENALPAVFGSPFHIGFYKGDCVALETLPTSEVVASIEGSIISGVACIWQDEASIILLSQNKNLVTAYDISSSQPDILNTVREIDITKIVE